MKVHARKSSVFGGFDRVHIWGHHIRIEHSKSLLELELLHPRFYELSNGHC